jgi:hypothetical protein
MYSSTSSKQKLSKQKRVASRKVSCGDCERTKDERIDRSATSLRQLPASIKGLSVSQRPLARTDSQRRATKSSRRRSPLVPSNPGYG